MTKVVPVFRIVPNGVVKRNPKEPLSAAEGQNGAARLSITVLASPSVDAANGIFDLMSWPESIAKWLEDRDFKLDLFIEQITRNGTVRPSCRGDGKLVRAELANLRIARKSRGAKSQYERVISVWQNALGGARGFAKLEQALSHSAANKAFNLKMDQPLPQGEELDRAIAAALDDKGAIKGKGSGQGEAETVATVLGIGHADLASFLQIERGSAVCRSMASARPPLVRGVSRQQTTFVENQKTARAASNATDNRAQIDEASALRTVRVERLKDAVTKTTMARRDADATFRRIVQELENSGCIDPSQATHVGQFSQSTPDAAVQQYGSWPQQGGAHQESPTDAVSQAFYALQSSPTLSRLFGLAFDAEIVIREDQLGSFPQDGITYAFLGPDKNLCDMSRAATAIRVEFSDGQAVGFLPATRSELMLTADCSDQQRDLWLDARDQRDGLVPMSATIGSKERFELTSLDVRRAIDQALDADTGNDGKSVAKLMDEGQRYSTIGFTFNDRRRSTGVMEELAMVGRHRGDAGPPDATLYAEDLTIGDVIDVRVEWPGQEPSEWRCLMERHVEFDPLEDLDAVVPPLVGARKSLRRMDLECGLVTAATRVMPSPALSSIKGTNGEPVVGEGDSDARFVDLVVEEAIATWTGAPMGVDTGAKTHRLPQHALTNMRGQDERHAAIVRTLGLPGKDDPGADRRSPMALYGVPYRFGMRRKYQGGCGLNLEDAQRLYNDSQRPYLLPRNGPKVFRRNESILQPDVLMLTSDARREYDIMGFENSLEVVLRRANGTLDSKEAFFIRSLSESPYPLNQRTTPISATRVIMPPTVSMEEAARHGVFEGKAGYENWRSGAMPALSFKGGYAKCIDQREVGWNSEEVAVRRSDPTFDAGQGVATFRLRAPPASLAVEERFFPDPAARFLVIRLLRDGAEQYTELTRIIPFYERGKSDKSISAADYSSLTPIRLTFKTGDGITTGIDDNGALLLTDDKRAVQARDIVVRLAPSDDLHVHLWCIPDKETLADKFSLVEFMTACGVDDAAQKLHHHIQTKPVQELGAVQSITAVHAVNRPAVDPEIQIRSNVVDRLSPVTGEANSDHGGFILDGSLTLDLKSADTYEIYMTTAAPTGEMDDVTRERSFSKRRANVWPKNEASAAGELAHTKAKDIFGFDVASNGRVTLSRSVVLLARGDQVPPPEGGKDMPLELSEILAEGLKQAQPGRVGKVGKVAVPFFFPDKKARKLSIQPVSIGRHASKFETRATFGTVGGRRHQRLAVPLDPLEQSRVGRPTEVWLNAAMRPDVPVVAACEPSFSISYGPDRRMETIVTCEPNIRIRLPRPWFSSGEEERLAIMLAPEDETLSLKKATVSRWGADPIWPGTKGEEELRGFDHFDMSRCKHRYRKVKKYDLSLGPPDDPTKVTAPVALLIFEPHFDVDRQEWFVDVPMDSNGSAQPFVHLVLVRYQEHTSPNFPKTSEPITAQAQIMPTRHVTTHCREEANGDWSVTVKMKGLSNFGPEVPLRLRSPDIIRPRLTVRLFHESRESGILRRLEATPEDCKRLEIGDRWDHIDSADQMTWTLSATIKKERRQALGPGRYSAFLVETQRFMPATYKDKFPEPVSWSDMNRSETLITTGSRFSLRVDLKTPEAKKQSL